MPMISASGWWSTRTRYAVVARMPSPNATRNRPWRSAARARQPRLQPIAGSPKNVIEPEVDAKIRSLKALRRELDAVIRQCHSGTAITSAFSIAVQCFNGYYRTPVRVGHLSD